MPDIRQSQNYANFMQSFGWQVEKIGKWQAFIKKFPLIGSLIKIQRISPPIPYKEIEKLSKKYRSFRTVIEFSSPSSLSCPPDPFRMDKNPFLPTKTILIDLTPSEKEIFNSFTPEKRRAIRRAEKKNIIIKRGNAKEFIYLKRKSLLEKGILPIGDKKDILALEKSFSPENIVFLISYPSSLSNPSISSRSLRPLAGILLLFYQKTAYYWQAANLNEGKKLSAPSLLVWEALKIAKAYGCKVLDFEGIYDERFPNKSWLGFTRFKQGFGGKEVNFPAPLSSSKFSFTFPLSF